MAAEGDTPSLYRTFSNEPILPAGPETSMTATIETIDNDRPGLGVRIAGLTVA